MPTWNDILAEVGKAGSTHDVVRRKYLKRLAGHTKRNTIALYSGWLQKADTFRKMPFEFSISDADKNGLMAVIHKMDRAKGLDLVLHTPGGDMAATESLIDYLRQMFGTNVRAIIPQLAMSGGTMMALSCREIIMGKHSNLGPIDPQLGGVAAHTAKEEFEKAIAEVQLAPHTAPIWQIIISKYGPTQISESVKAIAWADQMTTEWLKTGMFKGDKDADAKAAKVVQELGSHALTLSHSRHISFAAAKALDLKVTALEDDQVLQDDVLSVHHAMVITLGATPAVKIIENDRGVAFINSAQALLIPIPAGS